MMCDSSQPCRVIVTVLEPRLVLVAQPSQEAYDAGMSAVVVGGEGYIVFLQGEDAEEMKRLDSMPVSRVTWREMREIAAKSTCRRSAVFELRNGDYEVDDLPVPTWW